MTKTHLPTAARESFESLKQSNEHGAEYWSARKLQTLLGYTQWRRFEQAIERAIASCETSGNNPANHFAGAGKMVGLGSGSQRQKVCTAVLGAMPSSGARPFPRKTTCSTA